MAHRSLPVRIAIAVGLLAAGFAGGWFANEYRTRGLPLADIRAAYANGQHALCLRLAKARLRATGDADPEAALFAARAASQIGEWSEAQRYFAQSVLRDPDDWALSVRAEGNLNRPTEAIAACNFGLKQFPDNPRLLELLARLQASAGRHREALAAVERLDRIPEKAVVARLIAGITHYSTKNYRDCAANLQKALEADPELKSQSADFPAIDRLTALRFLSEALLLTDNPGAAEPYAKDAYAASKAAEDAWTLAVCFRETGRQDEQRRWLGETLKCDPQHVRAHVETAALDVAARDFARAEDHLKQALARAPEDRQAKHLMDAVRRQTAKPPVDGAKR